MGRPRRPVDPGTVFSHLTVIAEVEPKEYPGGAIRRQFTVRCICGKVLVADLWRMIREETTRCGKDCRGFASETDAGAIEAADTPAPAEPCPPAPPVMDPMQGTIPKEVLEGTADKILEEIFPKKSTRKNPKLKALTLTPASLMRVDGVIREVAEHLKGTDDVLIPWGESVRAHLARASLRDLLDLLRYYRFLLVKEDRDPPTSNSELSMARVQFEEAIALLKRGDDIGGMLYMNLAMGTAIAACGVKRKEVQDRIRANALEEA